MKNSIKNLIFTILIFSGIFCNAFAWDSLNAANENNTFYISQLAYFMLATGILGAILIYQKNKWIGWLAIACSIGLFKTFLFANAPKLNMFESAIIGYLAFFIYYFIRQVNLKENCLKCFLVPAIANIVLVFIQYFDNSLFLPMPFDGVSGFIGCKGMTAAYLALTLPLFFKYLKWGILPCILAIIICNGAVGLIAATLGGLVYIYNVRERREVILWNILVSLVCVLMIQSPKFDEVKTDAHLRASMMVGTFDGIKHNPILGWGVGSFIPIISRISPEDSEYLGRKFNTDNAIMNHPHNEILSGWWKIGISFPILLIIGFIDFLRKFRKELLMSFTIIIIGAVISMGWFLTLPSLILLIVAFGVYENSLNQRRE